MAAKVIKGVAQMSERKSVAFRVELIVNGEGSTMTSAFFRAIRDDLVPKVISTTESEEIFVEFLQSLPQIEDVNNEQPFTVTLGGLTMKITPLVSEQPGSFSDN
jgi:hypothetical protein